MQLAFDGALWFWRGPSPFHFVTVPEREAGLIAVLSPLVSYGWGMIPVAATVGATLWSTALWPKDGAYIVPIKAAVRRAEKLEVGQLVTLGLVITT